MVYVCQTEYTLMSLFDAWSCCINGVQNEKFIFTQTQEKILNILPSVDSEIGLLLKEITCTQWEKFLYF